ncbi:MAG: class II aldolase/adducin family protein [Candidatus Hydrogenedens sp.]|nr:class II aldolase/adducin family protein [Candidatus Hydrogenedentota bacterium]NLF58077.1 class II aldolase/adducin family protein [Candidatus Hydrogenedens sp.]
MTDKEARAAVCEAGRRLYAKNLVAATDGNISVRLGRDRYICTPSGVSKGFMTPEMLVVADGKGNKIRGGGKVTSEFFTHLAAYEERPDIGAVVHAHPAYATALTLAGISMTDAVVPEVIMTLCAIPTTAYATPGCAEGADVVRPWIRDYDAILLDRHGAVTVGKTVFEAYLKMEKLEHTAQVLYAAHCLGRVRTLHTDMVEKLMACYSGGVSPTPPYPFPLRTKQQGL